MRCFNRCGLGPLCTYSKSAVGAPLSRRADRSVPGGSGASNRCGLARSAPPTSKSTCAATSIQDVGRTGRPTAVSPGGGTAGHLFPACGRRAAGRRRPDGCFADRQAARGAVRCQAGFDYLATPAAPRDSRRPLRIHCRPGTAGFSPAPAVAVVGLGGYASVRWRGLPCAGCRCARENAIWAS